MRPQANNNAVFIKDFNPCVLGRQVLVRKIRINAKGRHLSYSGYFCGMMRRNHTTLFRLAYLVHEKLFNVLF